MISADNVDAALVIGITGALLLAIAMFSHSLKRLPVSAAMVYLAAGIAIGPLVSSRLGWTLAELAPVLEHVTELLILVSLFIAGLKLGLPVNHAHWKVPLRLATVSMAVTVLLVAPLAAWILGLPLGAAIVLAALLSPTDPVLATEVQVRDLNDRDRLRINLTGEAALNDGTAFPFVMLGLGLLGLHELGDFGVRWLALDVLWACAGGIALGGLCGWAVSRAVLRLRARHRMALGRDEFVALGLLAVTYSLSLLTLTYGFLAVFAAAYTFARKVESAQAARNSDTPPHPQAIESDQGQSVRDEAEPPPAELSENALGFNEQLERIGELLMVLLVGCLLWTVTLSVGAFLVAIALQVLVRPIAVWIGLLGLEMERPQRRLTAWLGIRGVGSLFYFSYAVGHGLDRTLVEPIAATLLLTVALSIGLHGLTVTPLMRAYTRRREPHA